MKGKGYNENRVQLWLPGTLISPHSECRCVTLHQVAGGLWLVRGSICPAVIGCQPRVTLCPLISDSDVWSLFCLIIMILTPAQTSLWQVRPGRDKAHYSGIITHHNSNMVTHHITSHPHDLNTVPNAPWCYQPQEKQFSHCGWHIDTCLLGMFALDIEGKQPSMNCCHKRWTGPTLLQTKHLHKINMHWIFTTADSDLAF